jgi:hypothetical protein
LLESQAILTIRYLPGRALTDELDGEAYLELAHDALIFGWGRLLSWVREDALRIADLRRLTHDAEQWSFSPKQKSTLLWSDAARMVAVKQLQNNKTPGLTFSESRFASVSVYCARRNRIIRVSITTVLVILCLAHSCSRYFLTTDVLQRNYVEMKREVNSSRRKHDCVPLVTSECQERP